MRILGFDAATLWLTAGFGLLVAAIAFCLGFFLMRLDVGRAALLGAGLGLAQSGGSLFYIWRRFVRPGPPPKGGGQPG